MTAKKKFLKFGFVLISVLIILYFLVTRKNYWRKPSFTNDANVFKETKVEFNRPQIAAASTSSMFAELLPAVYDDDRYVMANLPPVNSIPKILHFMWKNNRIPSKSVPNIQKWIQLHPHWTFVFWTDADIEKLMKTIFDNNDIYKMFKQFRYSVMRSDFIRYVILYTIGGVYADIDVLPLRSLDPVLAYHSCVVAREVAPLALALGGSSTILATNFLMASRPGHPFWPHLIALIKARKPTNFILFYTGPMALTEALSTFNDRYRRARRDLSVFLAPAMYFEPPLNPKGDALHNGMLKLQCKNYQKRTDIVNYLRRLCAILEKENRMDFDAMYTYPRFHNDSFTKHFFYGTYNNFHKDTYVPISNYGFKLVSPSSLMQRHGMKDPYVLDKEIGNSS